jgi:DNA invertase Pin-like site-specific DNA recombinase
MTKAVAYMRVSGPSQLDGDGFPRQREAIKGYASLNGLHITHWFEEKAVPGKTEWEDRPAWGELIASLNGVRTIVIEKLDRLARDLIIQEKAIIDLTARGVTLLSASEPDLMATDPTRIMMRQIIGSIHQYEKSMLVLKLKASRDRKKKQTGRCEGALPFGAPGSLADEQEVLERVRAMRVDGLNWGDCADSLNSMGYHTRPTKTRPKGCPWYGANLRRLLSGPTPPDQIKRRKKKCDTPNT